jgi:hypothetical protein
MDLLEQDPRATADMRKVPAWKKAAEFGSRSELDENTYSLPSSPVIVPTC